MIIVRLKLRYFLLYLVCLSEPLQQQSGDLTADEQVLVQCAVQNQYLVLLCSANYLKGRAPGAIQLEVDHIGCLPAKLDYQLPGP